MRRHFRIIIEGYRKLSNCTPSFQLIPEMISAHTTTYCTFGCGCVADMAHLCRRNFKSWKACLILVCNVVLYGASRLTAAALLSKDSSGNNGVVHVLASNMNILSNSRAVLYIIVGILTDIRFGRYKVVAYSISSASRYCWHLRQPV